MISLSNSPEENARLLKQEIDATPAWAREVAYDLCLDQMSDPEKPMPVRVFGNGSYVDVTEPYWRNFTDHIDKIAAAMRRHGWKEPS